jgi:transposase
MIRSYMALDTHCTTCDLAVLNRQGNLAGEDHVPTTIPALRRALAAFPRPCVLTFEEGPLAGWLSRNLRSCVDELIVCDPRRNALVAKEGDKDDPIDARKLARLLFSKFIKPVHQAQTQERAILKQHVAFYHDHVRDRVRQGHQLIAQLRRHGVICSIEEAAEAESRTELWKQLPASPLLRRDLERLLQRYQLCVTQEDELRLEFIRLARREKVVRRLEEVPGIGWIRALTFYVLIDTPERFTKKSKLWKYCGLGLEKNKSGKRSARLRVCKEGNRLLKGLLIGAAQNIIPGQSPYAEHYRALLQQGLHPNTARRHLARQLATTLWTLWKKGTRYDPSRIRVMASLAT